MNIIFSYLSVGRKPGYETPVTANRAAYCRRQRWWSVGLGTTQIGGSFTPSLPIELRLVLFPEPRVGHPREFRPSRQINFSTAFSRFLKVDCMGKGMIQARIQKRDDFDCDTK